MFARRSSTLHTTPAPPGPRGYPLVGVLPELYRDPLGFMRAVTREYGDIVHLGQRWYLIPGPQYLKHVLQDHSRNYRKGDNIRPLKLLTGEGLLTSDGDFWLRQRRMAQPAFHHQRIATMATKITDCTADLLQRWQPLAERGAPLDVADDMMRLTMQIIGLSLFSVDVSSQADLVGRALIETLHYINRRATSLIQLPHSLPTPGTLRFRRALQQLDSVVLGMIEGRRRSGEDAGDLLSMLLQARDAETGQGMTDRQLRDEVMNIFLAGHDTTGLVLSWTWYLLAQHPAVERRLHAELRAVLAGRTPTVADLPDLPYTQMVIQESMRLYPPAWMTSRTPLKPDRLGPYDIPAGATILVSPYATHHHPGLWDDPARFDPDRFAPDAVERPKFAYFPFGGGPRLCIGNHLALMEMQLAVAMIAQQYQLRLVPGHPIEMEPLTTLRPRYGVRMTIQPRSG